LLLRLKRSGFGEKEAESAARVCREQGLIDDAASARLWADHWARGLYSWAEIQRRLAAKGFERSQIEPLADTLSGHADEARARRMVRRLAPLGDPAKVGRRLAARGFDAEVIERSLRAKRR